MDMVSKLKITSAIVVLILVVLTALIMLPKQAAAQSNSCMQAIGNCNYEFTTNGVTPSFVSAQAYITNTMAVQSYTGGETVLALLYNPDINMVCGPLAWYYGSTGYWDQGVIIYGVIMNRQGNRAP